MTMIPTGDIQKDTDTLRRAVAAPFDGPLRHVVLGGKWTVNRTLECDETTVVAGYPVAAIDYKGQRTEEPLLTMRGYYSRAENLWFNSNRLCRGVKMSDVHHGEILNNVRIIWPRQIGLDMDRCWYGSCRNVELSGCRGVAMKAYQSNSSLFSNFKLANCWGWWHADGNFWSSHDPYHVDLWTYASQHTDAETRMYFDECLLEDWPDEISRRDRAGIVCHGCDQLEFQNLSFEPVSYSHLPALLMRGVTTAVVRQLRFESGWSNRDSALLDIANSAQVKLDNMLTIPTRQGPAGYAVGLRGTTSLVEIEGLDCREGCIVGEMVDNNEGTHSGLTIKRSKGWSDTARTKPLPTMRDNSDTNLER